MLYSVGDVIAAELPVRQHFHRRPKILHHDASAVFTNLIDHFSLLPRFRA